MLNRDVTTQINGLHIDNYVRSVLGNTTNLRDSWRNVTGDAKLNDSKELSHSLKDGIDGFFARNGFELMDLTPNLPLAGFFHYENVPVRFGGGYAEQVTAFRLNYQLAEGRLAGSTTNERNVTGTIEEKIIVPTYAFLRAVNVTEFELIRSNKINYDIFGHRAEALRLSYQRELELFAFVGNLGVNGITTGDAKFVGGLLNQPKDDVFSAFYGSDWYTALDLDTLITKIIGLAQTMKIGLRFDSSKYPNSLVLPSDLYGALVQPAVIGDGDGGNVPLATSKYEYLKRQLEFIFNTNFSIRELPYIGGTITADDTTAGIVEKGVGTKDGLILLYRMDETVARMHVPMPLTGGAVYKAKDGWWQDYLSLVTPLLVIYPAIGYLYNGAVE